jgi:Zn finger protein HypA/HybF involved in hydrogenase expression
MHELSVIVAVADTVDEYLKASYGEAAGKPAPKVTRVTLQIGGRSSYLPSYVREIWPVAVKGTSLEGAAVETEDIEGRDFLIKEIEVEEL